MASSKEIKEFLSGLLMFESFYFLRGFFRDSSRLGFLNALALTFSCFLACSQAFMCLESSSMGLSTRVGFTFRTVCLL